MAGAVMRENGAQNRQAGYALLSEAVASFQANGWDVSVADTPEDARARVLTLIEGAGAVALRIGPYWERLGLEEALTGRGGVTLCGPGREAPARAALLTADLGITGATALVVDTATAMLAADDAYAQLVSNLPFTHIVVAETVKLVRTPAEGLGLVRLWAETCLGKPVPRYIGGVSGPSRTGDIEMTIVQGMHGPGRVHLVLLKTDDGDIASRELLAT